MGEVEYVLGIEITRDRPNRLLTLSQGSYLATVLKRFDMAMCKPIDTPICKSIKLSNDQRPTNEQDKEVMRMKPYAQIVGQHYVCDAMYETRPYIRSRSRK